MNRWTRANFQPNRPLYPGKYVTASKEHVALSKEAAKESMVLLKNEPGADKTCLLPLKKGSRVALFGKGSFDYVKGGGGSGDVTVSYIRNLYEGMKAQADVVSLYEPISDFYRENVKKQYQKGGIAGMLVEPELTEEQVKGARAFADTAIIVLSRFSGEGWDRSEVEFCDELNPWDCGADGPESLPHMCGRVFPEGDFYLSGEEKAMIEQVKAQFEKIVVVLNVGGVMDTCWIKEDEQISAALMMWQGGMEGGVAAAELLCGKGNPSGKLPDTFANRLEDYPSTEKFHESPYYVDYEEDIYVGYRYFETIPGASQRVSYPFGYGLSYTKFDIEVENITINATVDEEEVDEWDEDEIALSAEALAQADLQVQIKVTNTGKRAGKEVAALYYSAPQGALGKPKKELGAFAKTRELAEGESQVLTLILPVKDMASYDDLGKVAKSAYLLEAGTYGFYVGANVAEAEELEFALELSEDVITEQLSTKMQPTGLAQRMLADGGFEKLPQLPKRDPNSCAFEKMVPGSEEAIAPQIPGREQYLLWETIKKGVHSFYEVAEGSYSLNDFVEQLTDEELIHLLGGQPNRGVANTFGFGNLMEYGVPNIMTADGPAGVRIGPECGVCTTAFPCSTALAATWNTELVEAVGHAGGEELKENNLCVWLTPAINIHRNPLCGRNFEYYSEDPYLVGEMAGAMVRGIQSNRVGACVKHFACNNKETNRKHCDSRVSERALREIYLKGFERIVKKEQPWSMMSSYNVINGYRASEAKELLEDILRGEWGYEGVVTSDWWTRGEQYKEILAGNDIKMGCGFPDRVKKALDMGEITREDLKRSAKRVLNLILKVD